MKGRAKTLKLTSLNFYVYTRHFLHCLYFIYARKIYVRTHVRITRQWKSNLKEKVFTLVSCTKRLSDWRSWQLSLLPYNNTNIHLHQFFAFYLKLPLLVQALENKQLSIVFNINRNSVLGLHILRDFVHDCMISNYKCSVWGRNDAEWTVFGWWRS